VVPEVQAHVIPEAVSFEAAAALPVNWLTAWIMLVYLGNVHPGERVLVHAAAGGVGQAAVQIARWRGAEVIGTASPSKHERLREAGVTHCIDYRSQDFESEVRRLTNGQGVHVALDAIGGSSLTKSYRCLAPLGRVYTFGVSSFAPAKTRTGNLFAALMGLLSTPAFRPIPMMNANRGVHGINLGHLWDQQETMGAILREIVGHVADGTFAPVVDGTFPFDRAAAAHERLQGRENFGKVLLVA
jgi:NADPH:quinone reductase-like Zn-dependent oxidoreductase